MTHAASAASSQIAAATGFLARNRQRLLNVWINGVRMKATS
jgi:hypothetical protein